MKISEAAIERGNTVFVFLFIILITGGYSYFAMPREANPEVIIPYVNVTTSYEGVSAEDIESLVTVPIERKLTGISGVKEIISSSVEGTSIITIEFDTNTVIEDALQKVRDKVDQAKGDLPTDADDPTVSEINIAELPIIWISLTGEIGPAALTLIAEDLEDRIEAINGVLGVEVIGGVEREIYIEVDPGRVVQYGVSLADLVTVTQLENVNTPGGALELGEAKYLMRTPGEFKTPDEMYDLVVKRGETGAVYLRDIAVVTDGFKDLATMSRVNGAPSVTLTVSKRSGQNVITISDAVQQVLEDMRRDLPPGVSLDLVMDQSTFVRDMVSELENSILTGLILVLAVIFIFMGFTNALFVGMAIPISMLVGFCVLHLAGITLNIVVLFSLIFSLGMLVDNGIVVIENIYRLRQAGMERVEAARQGIVGVAWPIAGSTITTVVAFLPLLFWPGIWGSFMSYLPKTVIITLLASLFVGLIVNPVFAAWFMPAPKRALGPGTPGRHAVLHVYERLLRLAIRWRAVTVTAAFAALVSVISLYSVNAQLEFVPKTEPQRAWIDVDCPEGTNLETTDMFVRQVEALVKPHEENIDFLIANTGSRGLSQMGGPSAGTSHIGRVTLDFPDLEDCTVLPSEIVRAIRPYFTDIAGAEIRVEHEDEGPPSGPPVNVEISGEDFRVLAQLAAQVRKAIRDVPGLVDIRDDYEEGKPEVQVEVDREQAWLTGLNTQFIGLTVKAAIEGRVAGKFREGDEEYDVVVRFPKEFRENLANLESMTLVNLEGRPIAFSSVARLKQDQGLGTIKRIDRKRTVTVMADVDTSTGRTGNDALNDVQAILKDFPLPAGYTISYTGENEEQEEAMSFLSKAFLVALLLIFLVLVTQFNSLAQPLIIMSAVILSLVGVFLGLIVFDMPFSVIMTGMACVSLAGVVVNNGIVLIDFINQLRAQGMPVEEAIVQGGITRFRPVMLTAITTILGLIPMAIRVSFDFREFKWIINSWSSQWWGPMAVAIISGLTVATVLTLVVAPALYSYVDSLARVFARPPALEDTEEAARA